jgi:hypothetical protein
MAWPRARRGGPVRVRVRAGSWGGAGAGWSSTRRENVTALTTDKALHIRAARPVRHGRRQRVGKAPAWRWWWWWWWWWRRGRRGRGRCRAAATTLHHNRPRPHAADRRPVCGVHRIAATAGQHQPTHVARPPAWWRQWWLLPPSSSHTWPRPGRAPVIVRVRGRRRAKGADDKGGGSRALVVRADGDVGKVGGVLGRGEGRSRRRWWWSGWRRRRAVWHVSLLFLRVPDDPRRRNQTWYKQWAMGHASVWLGVVLCGGRWRRRRGGTSALWKLGVCA